MQLLSTKILSKANTSKLQQYGIALTTHSFIQISLLKPQPWPQAAKVNAIFTSANAVMALKDYKFDLPKFEFIFCIAGATEKIAKATFGDNPKYYARTYAATLAQDIIMHQNTNALWFFKGNRSLATIPDALQSANIAFEAFEVYQNDLNPQKMEQSFDAILFFSPSAVESYLIHNFIPDNTITFAIGKTTAAALQGHARQIQLADAPSENTVIEALIRHFNS